LFKKNLPAKLTDLVQIGLPYRIAAIWTIGWKSGFCKGIQTLARLS